MHVECIVNTANPYSVIGDGCDSAIYHAAGSSELLAYRNTLGEFKKCDVFLTKIFLYIHKKDDGKTERKVWMGIYIHRGKYGCHSGSK